MYFLLSILLRIELLLSTKKGVIKIKLINAWIKSLFIAIKNVYTNIGIELDFVMAEIKARAPPFLVPFFSNEVGAMIGMGIAVSVIGVVITIVILANVIPVLWPIATTASANVTSMTGTDVGTTTIVSFWPIALLVIGIGIAVGVIIYGLKAFGLIGD